MKAEGHIMIDVMKPEQIRKLVDLLAGESLPPTTISKAWLDDKHVVHVVWRQS